MSEAHSAAAQVTRLSHDFLAEYRSSGRYRRDIVDEIADIALAPDNVDAVDGTRDLFSSLIEPLADSFEPASVSVYNRVFAQLVQTCRRSEPALDSELARLGVQDEQDLIRRADSLRPRFEVGEPARANDPTTWRRLKRAIVLSRVTLGADVAITSVILERVRQELSEAEIILAGGGKMEELFGGDLGLGFHELGYQRFASLRDRLLSWLDVVNAVRHLTAGLTESEWVIVDPDSRLTQLGVLPLVHPSSASQYLFFPSREFGDNSTSALGKLAADWADEVFGNKRRTSPRISLKNGDVESGERLAGALRRSGGRSVATVNFGVGENDAKRVGGGFETALVMSLLREGAAVVLDRGAGEVESNRIDAIVARARAERAADDMLRVLEIEEEGLPAVLARESLKTDVLVWRGRIGLLGALIRASDCYIGYDSAGQHIAAALGAPCVDVIAGAPSARFIQRWKPVGSSEAAVVVADGSRAVEQLAAEVIGHWRRIALRDT